MASVTTLLLILLAPVAAAEGLGQTPSVLAWIDLKDSAGIPMWHHELSLDRGGVLAPDKFAWSYLIDSTFNVYRSVVAVALWFLDWVMSFEWVGIIATPLIAVADAMQQVINNLGLVPTFLAVTALVGGLLMLRGRTSAGVWEIALACLIAALATGVWARPVDLVAGPNGYVVKSAQLGQEIAAGLATGETAGMTTEQLRTAQTGHLVDTFIRQPTQLLNYGQVLDGGPCEGAYNDAVRGGPYGSASTIRDKVASCDQTLGDYASNPNGSMATAAIIFQPAGYVVVLLAALLAGSVITAGAWAMYQSLKAVWSLVVGLLPGGGRGSLLITVAEVLVSLTVIVFTNLFLSVFLLILQAVFSSTIGGGDDLARTFVIVDVLIVVALVVFMRQRRQLKGMSGRLAQWMAQRPGAGPTRLPAPAPRFDALGSAVRTVASVGHWRTSMAAARGAPASGGGGPLFIDARQQAAFLGVAAAGAPRQPGYAYQTGRPHPSGQTVVEGEVGPGPFPVTTPSLAGARAQHALPGTTGPAPVDGAPSRPELPPGPGSPPSNTGTQPNPPRPGTDRGVTGAPLTKAQSVKRMARTLLQAGASAALGYATGGASSAVQAASKAGGVIRAARRAALTARLRSAATAASSRPAEPVTRSGFVVPRPAPAPPPRPAATTSSDAGPSPRMERPPAVPPVAPRRPPAAGPGRRLQPQPAGASAAPAVGATGDVTRSPSPQQPQPPARAPKPEAAASGGTERAQALRARLQERIRQHSGQ